MRPNPAVRAKARWGFELSQLLVLIVLQLAFSVAFVTVGQEGILSLPTSSQQFGAYTLVNTFRWAADGWLLSFSVRFVLRTLRARAPQPTEELPRSIAPDADVDGQTPSTVEVLELGVDLGRPCLGRAAARPGI